MDEIVFRGYREWDLDALFRLDEACFEEPFRFSRAAMRRFAEAKRALVVVAEADGDVVGFCIVHVEGAGERVGYVVTLDVAEARRRMGLARALMERLEVLAQDEGCETMGLHVSVANRGAIRFYERMGYELVGKDEGFYEEGGDASVYRKRFSWRRLRGLYK